MSRELTVETTLNATPERVWRALTEAEELMRWFPVYARVEPEKSIWISWGEGVEGEGKVEVWEPGKRLRVAETSGLGVEYLIESQSGGKSVLRIVHSGFGDGSEWDGFIEGATNGWAYFLINLAHYLDRHDGSPRRVASVRWPVSGTRDEIAARVLGAEGLGIEAVPSSSGKDRVVVRLGGKRVNGDVVLDRPGRIYATTLDELNAGLLLVEFEGPNVGVWVSLYGAAESAGDAIEAGLRETMQRLYPKQEQVTTAS